MASQRFGTMQGGYGPPAPPPTPATPDASGPREAQLPLVARPDPQFATTIPADAVAHAIPVSTPRPPTRLADWNRERLAPCSPEELRALFTQRSDEWVTLTWRELVGLSDDQLAGIPDGYFVATKPFFNPEPEEVANSERLPRAIVRRYKDEVPARSATVMQQLEASTAHLRQVRLMRVLFCLVILLSLWAGAMILKRIGWL